MSEENEQFDNASPIIAIKLQVRDDDAPEIKVYRVQVIGPALKEFLVQYYTENHRGVSDQELGVAAAAVMKSRKSPGAQDANDGRSAYQLGCAAHAFAQADKHLLAWLLDGLELATKGMMWAGERKWHQELSIPTAREKEIRREFEEILDRMKERIGLKQGPVEGTRREPLNIVWKEIVETARQWPSDKPPSAAQFAAEVPSLKRTKDHYDAFNDVLVQCRKAGLSPSVGRWPALFNWLREDGKDCQ